MVGRVGRCWRNEMRWMLLGKEKERRLVSEVRDNEFRAGETHRPERRGQVRIKTLPPDRSKPGSRFRLLQGGFLPSRYPPCAGTPNPNPQQRAPQAVAMLTPAFQ
jgi:hypothetical protein